ncbi:hypothetical protein GCK72_008071 [Caenorhabditis remanei]|uniref:PAN-3 domain-containing protein n=1 Tax=Caenorhabditis remanei TaxID=31234 RepID=A0A6A5HIV9_CAERE|nr:hypothetical protein GCK72_008071 [Caenorhabditis remanei]KAF1768110.1 hypothetical protein GCK72_008071 [Caenorhabditis remanei]
MIFLLLLCFPIQSFTQDTTLTPPVYKMVNVLGAPDPENSFPMIFSTGVAWDDCVQLCYNEPLCALVYGNSSLICVQYYIGDVSTVRKDKEESVAMEKVSFKIQVTTEEQKMCTSLNAVLNGAGTTVHQNLTKSYRIAISDDFYNITYENKGIPECAATLGPNMKCKTGCNATMVSFRGYFHQRMEKTGALTTKSWFDCLIRCYNTNWCFLAEMIVPTQCYLYVLDEFVLRTFPNFNVQEVSENNSYLAMKIFAMPSTHSKAEFYCSGTGSDGLMTIPDVAGLNEISEVLNTIDFAVGFVHVGLMRATESSPWEWKLPNLTRDDTELVKVLSKETLDQPGLYSALHFQKGEPLVLHSITDTDVGSAFICHFNN